MSDKTKIEWADATLNPAYGCTKISPACANCYAARMSDRMQHNVQVCQYFEGLTDRDVAARAHLKKTHVSEILTNTFYNGVIREGYRRPAVIDDGLWAQVQEMRSRHSRRHPGPATYRQYLWSGLIRCRACGRVLTPGFRSWSVNVYL